LWLLLRNQHHGQQRIKEFLFKVAIDVNIPFEFEIPSRQQNIRRMVYIEKILKFKVTPAVILVEM